MKEVMKAFAKPTRTIYLRPCPAEVNETTKPSTHRRDDNLAFVNENHRDNKYIREAGTDDIMKTYLSSSRK